MMRVFVGAVLLSVAVTVRGDFPPTPEGFQSWMSQHNRPSLDSTQHQAKFDTWLSNHAIITAHNARADAGLETFRVSLNKFADMTHAEFAAKYLRPKPERVAAMRDAAAIGVFEANPAATPPANWSWVSRGVVTPIKNQGDCGSCWAFSAVAAMEGAYNLAHHGQPASQCSTQCGYPSKVPCCSFSEQEVVDCTLGGADTCNIGGEPHDGIMLIAKQDGGVINTEAQYPYTSGSKGQMSACKPVANGVQTGVSGYVNVTSGDETALTQAAYKFPIISVGIDASDPLFQFYSGGIYNSQTCKNKPKDLDHGVAVVGFGVGNPVRPGPPAPSPGPSDCDTHHYEAECVTEKGCYWCHDKYISWCQNTACNATSSDSSSSSSSSTTPAPSPSSMFLLEAATNAVAPTAWSPQEATGNQFIPALEQGGVAANQQYYMVKNSWGADWGLAGFIAMTRDGSNQCGIATDAVYAVLG